MIDRTRDALYYASKLKTGDCSSEELIHASFKRIAQENPKLNAVIHTRKEEALKEAQSRHWADTPFKGIPILLKDLGQNLAGFPATAGSKLLKHYRADKTSYFVSQLQAAGFIPIGSTNVPEFGFTNITHSELYGPARNPFDTALSAGGSSGGASAAVASGMVPLAGASDGGGSIRIPASFTGLVGLKPTRGRTPIGPGSGRAWQGAAISFALTKTIRDTAALLDQMQVLQPAAAFSTPLFTEGFLNSLDQAFEKPLTVAFSLTSPIGGPVSNDARQAVLQAVDWLENKGYAVEEACPDIDGRRLMQAYYAMNAGESAAMMGRLETVLDRPLGPDDMELLTWVLQESGKKLTAVEYANALTLWDDAAERMWHFNKTYDLYLQPATAHPAPRNDKVYWSNAFVKRMKQADTLSAAEQQQLIWDMWEESLDLTPFTQQANLTGQPAISLPTYMTREGLPLGIQLTAPKGREDWLLKIGQQMEQEGLFI
ncbi:6-aminohexanoate-cyclic-dimer hydrolase [Alkalibacterium sp. AK22]|uniref:amidase n=1 Tax=Alkalibacterium sp. AK22 TaxID=1229520 RepID=UPI0004466B02|nr:amidase [Alkalibacterium sp. AK22]EXJ23642.1 6-aminohexanoate-cyclic-dimer hydrolase [Alkalibacterium sp. AK22]